MNVEVRTITADGWPLVRDVSLRALTDSPDAFRRTLAEAQALTADFWRQQAEGSAPILVVLEDGRGVAMGGVFTPPDSAVAYVWGMWTAPEARGRGYAAKLLTDLVNSCRDRDLGVRLHVTEGNQAARRLYTAHGFKSTGVWEPLREGSALQVEELQLVERPAFSKCDTHDEASASQGTAQPGERCRTARRTSAAASAETVNEDRL